MYCKLGHLLLGIVGGVSEDSNKESPLFSVATLDNDPFPNSQEELIVEDYDPLGMKKLSVQMSSEAPGYLSTSPIGNIVLEVVRYLPGNSSIQDTSSQRWILAHRIEVGDVMAEFRSSFSSLVLAVIPKQHVQGPKLRI